MELEKLGYISGLSKELKEEVIEALEGIDIMVVDCHQGTMDLFKEVKEK